MYLSNKESTVIFCLLNVISRTYNYQRIMLISRGVFVVAIVIIILLSQILLIAWSKWTQNLFLYWNDFGGGKTMCSNPSHWADLRFSYCKLQKYLNHHHHLPRLMGWQLYTVKAVCYFLTLSWVNIQLPCSSNFSKITLL